MEADVPPADWKEVPLTAVAEALFSSVDKKARAGELPVRLCNYIDVYKNDYITDDLAFMRATATRTEIAQFGVRLGDVIVTKDSETPDDIGIPALLDCSAPDLVCGYHLALLRPNTSRVAPSFLAKQLRHPRLARYFGQQANGLTRYGLPKAAVQNAPLWIPTEPEEGEKIGEILRQLDTAIRESDAVLAKLRWMKAGLLHDLLTCGLDEHGQLRDSALHPEQFQDSPLGWIPRGWTRHPLSEVAEISSGVTLGRDLRGAGTVELPYLRVANVQDGFLDLSEIKTVRVLRSEVEAFRLRMGDVLMNEGGDFDKLGRGAVWRGEIDPCLHQNHVFRVRPDMSQILPPFLAAVSTSQIGKKYFLTSSKQSTNLASINSTQLKAFIVPCPLIEEQTAICRVLAAMDARMVAKESQLSKLHSLKSGLAHDLLTGRKRVKV